GNFADLFCLRLCCNDFSVVQKRCYLISDQSFSLTGSSTEFSILCHFKFPPLFTSGYASSGLLIKCSRRPLRTYRRDMTFPMQGLTRRPVSNSIFLFIVQEEASGLRLIIRRPGLSCIFLTLR